ncbi:hypothetical protein [Methylomonas rapida]|uniref:Uncharacterized protein n=1 Tax=Methylomonas rapida TaxID=2963939 RepID=A0ABY7GR28_9GAMM|nr:hypothetical protein [Methylomonas rapida]WAR46949.1 hypothetical protein NM686_010680 [Methylomonas rapida]
MKLQLKVDERGRYFQLITPSGEEIEGVLDISLGVGEDEYQHRGQSVYALVKFQVGCGALDFAGHFTQEAAEEIRRKWNKRCGKSHD